MRTVTARPWGTRHTPVSAQMRGPRTARPARPVREPAPGTRWARRFSPARGTLLGTQVVCERVTAQVQQPGKEAVIPSDPSETDPGRPWGLGAGAELACGSPAQGTLPDCSVSASGLSPHGRPGRPATDPVPRKMPSMSCMSNFTLSTVEANRERRETESEGEAGSREGRSLPEVLLSPGEAG